jgi:hypothetical protein
LDPTHVNFITANTHVHFTRPRRRASIYGFTGDFELRRAHWAKMLPEQSFTPPPTGIAARLRVAHRAWRAQRDAIAQAVWEFKAIKPAATRFRISS